MDNPKRLLLIQLKRAGDVIVTTPLLPALRHALPEARIDFLVDKPFAPLLENNPFINEVRIYDRTSVWATWRAVRAASYDWIIDFQSSPRSILAGLFSGARLRAGYRVPFWGQFFHRSTRRPGNDGSVTEGKMNLVRSLIPSMGAPGERQIFLTDSELKWASGCMGEKDGEKRVIGLVPTHRRPSRRWSAESFASLARLFLSQGYPVWLFWGPGEEELVSGIQRQVPKSRMIPPTSLRQMASLLERCQVVITNDNGPMHLATAVGTPTVTIYGPTDPASWNPGGLRHRMIQATGLTCLCCNLNACPFGHECMAWVEPERVFREAQNLALGSAAVAR
jgi:ADP-heptose:LPS heptosyltransferase